MNTDLDTMSRKELSTLKAEVEKALSTVADRERKAALAAAEKAAAAHGFTLAELTDVVAAKSANRSKMKSPAKYRNAANPDETWSGRGRKPRWLNEAEAAGRALSDFAI